MKEKNIIIMIIRNLRNEYFNGKRCKGKRYDIKCNITYE